MNAHHIPYVSTTYMHMYIYCTCTSTEGVNEYCYCVSSGPPEQMLLVPEPPSPIDPLDVLRCSAESNPPPSNYQWLDSVEGSIIASGDALLVPRECAGQQVCVTCVAFNQMKDGAVGQESISGCYNVSGSVDNSC